MIFLVFDGLVGCFAVLWFVLCSCYSCGCAIVFAVEYCCCFGIFVMFVCVVFEFWFVSDDFWFYLACFGAICGLKCAVDLLVVGSVVVV